MKILILLFLSMIQTIAWSQKGDEVIEDFEMFTFSFDVFEKAGQFANSTFLVNKRIKIFSNDSLIYDRWSKDTMMTVLKLRADWNHRIEISSDCHRSVVWKMEGNQKLDYRSFDLEKLEKCRFQAPTIYFENLKETTLDEGHLSNLDFWFDVIEEYPKETKFVITGYFSKKEKVAHALERAMKAERYLVSKGLEKNKIVVEVVKVNEFYLTPKEQRRLELSKEDKSDYE